MNVEPINPSAYLRPPRLSVRSGLSLAKMLLIVAPQRSGPGVRQAAETLSLAITTLEDAWKAQSVPRPPSSDPRQADMRLDRIWATIHASLERHFVFPEDDPDRLRAAAMIERLFPSGLRFIRLPFTEQHAESQRRVDLLEEEELHAELDHLVGETFRDELMQAHDAYGEALGITRATDGAPASVSVVEPLRALAGAITGYCIQVLAFAGIDAAKNTAAARRALEPIDQLRRAAARRNANAAGGSGGAANDDEDALPEGFPAPDAVLPVLPAA